MSTVRKFYADGGKFAASAPDPAVGSTTGNDTEALMQFVAAAVNTMQNVNATLQSMQQNGIKILYRAHRTAGRRRPYGCN